MAATTTTDYRETLADIESSLGFVPGFMEAIPEEALVHEWPVFKQYTLGESAIPSKYRELMELAVAATQKCEYCEPFHGAAAEMHGATEAELTETGSLASLSSPWSAMIHAQRYDHDTFEDEVHQIGAFLQENKQAGD